MLKMQERKSRFTFRVCCLVLAKQNGHGPRARGRKEGRGHKPFGKEIFGWSESEGGREGGPTAVFSAED